MKSKILLSSALLLASVSGMAQKNSNKAYAITGDGNNDYLWMNIRQVDLGTGQVQSTLFERSKTTYSLTDAASKAVAAPITDGNVFGSDKYPTGTYVAAAAFDSRSGNLYFMPMRVGELRWVNVEGGEANKFYSIKTSLVVPAADAREEGGNITRMAIAANGKGYALSNDGSNLIEFTTSKMPSLRSLGGLIDAEANGAISIHNKCSSWGGDMVSDAYGKLWVISANRHVFEVDPQTLVATYKGAITGLPGTFTTNGAAVNADGKLIVVSAITFEGYYAVDMKTLAAEKIEGSDVKYNASDLAGSAQLFQKEKDEASRFGAAAPVAAYEVDANTKVFPNPVTGNSFKVQLEPEANGIFTFIVSDLAGRVVKQQRTSLSKGQKIVTVTLGSHPASGSYMLKVVNEKQEIILTDKVIVQ